MKKKKYLLTHGFCLFSPGKGKRRRSKAQHSKILDKNKEEGFEGDSCGDPMTKVNDYKFSERWWSQTLDQYPSSGKNVFIMFWFLESNQGRVERNPFSPSFLSTALSIKIPKEILCHHLKSNRLPRERINQKRIDDRKPIFFSRMHLRLLFLIFDQIIRSRVKIHFFYWKLMWLWVGGTTRSPTWWIPLWTIQYLKTLNVTQNTLFYINCCSA